MRARRISTSRSASVARTGPGWTPTPPCDRPVAEGRRLCPLGEGPARRGYGIRRRSRPMDDRHERTARVLDPSYLGDVDARTTDELRVMQGECRELETEVSYVRRLTQARTDIV